MTHCAIIAARLGARRDSSSWDEWLAQSQKIRWSTALKRLSGCMSRYEASGIRLERMSAQAAASVPAAVPGWRPGPTAHVERFMARRARCTSRASSHDPGASLPYQGTTVSFEWQFRQARAKMADTAAGTSTLASIVCHCWTGGLSTPIPGVNWRITRHGAIVAASARA